MTTDATCDRIAQGLPGVPCKLFKNATVARVGRICGCHLRVACHTRVGPAADKFRISIGCPRLPEWHSKILGQHKQANLGRRFQSAASQMHCLLCCLWRWAWIETVIRMLAAWMIMALAMATLTMLMKETIAMLTSGRMVKMMMVVVQAGIPRQGQNTATLRSLGSPSTLQSQTGRRWMPLSYCPREIAPSQPCRLTTAKSAAMTSLQLAS